MLQDKVHAATMMIYYHDGKAKTLYKALKLKKINQRETIQNIPILIIYYVVYRILVRIKTILNLIQHTYTQNNKNKLPP